MYRGSVGMIDTKVDFRATGLDVQLCKVHRSHCDQGSTKWLSAIIPRCEVTLRRGRWISHYIFNIYFPSSPRKCSQCLYCSHRHPSEVTITLRSASSWHLPTTLCNLYLSLDWCQSHSSNEVMTKVSSFALSRISMTQKASCFLTPCAYKCINRDWKFSIHQ